MSDRITLKNESFQDKQNAVFALPNTAAILQLVDDWIGEFAKLSDYTKTPSALEDLRDTTAPELVSTSSVLLPEIADAIAALQGIGSHLDSITPDFDTLLSVVKNTTMNNALEPDAVIRMVQMLSVAYELVNDVPVLKNNLLQTELNSLNVLSTSFLPTMKGQLLNAIVDKGALPFFGTNAEIESPAARAKFEEVFQKLSDYILNSYVFDSNRCSTLQATVRTLTPTRELTGDFVKTVIEDYYTLNQCKAIAGSDILNHLTQAQISVTNAIGLIDQKIENLDIVIAAKRDHFSDNFKDSLVRNQNNANHLFWALDGCGPTGNNAAMDLKLSNTPKGMNTCNTNKNIITSNLINLPYFHIHDDGKPTVDLFDASIDNNGVATLSVNPAKLPDNGAGLTPRAMEKQLILLALNSHLEHLSNLVHADSADLDKMVTDIVSFLDENGYVSPADVCDGVMC